jgi:hypothetical protein
MGFRDVECMNGSSVETVAGLGAGGVGIRFLLPKSR